MMNVRNEPLHDVACVLKRSSPPVGGGDFVSFNIKKTSFSWEQISVEGVSGW